MSFHEAMRVGFQRHPDTRQATNPVRAARRAAIKAAGGIRQFKRQTRMTASLI